MENKELEQNVEKNQNQEEIDKKMKNRRIIKLVICVGISILVLVFVTVVFLSYMLIGKNKKDVIEQNNNALIKTEEKIEYGTKLNGKDILAKLVKMQELAQGTDIKVYINNEELDENKEYSFDTIGDIKFKIETFTNIVEFLKESVGLDIEIIWKVEDTKMPIISGTNDKEILFGSDFDKNTGITAYDEVDGELEVVVEGEVDTSKAGEYNLKAKAVDKNQNETVKEFKVIVKEAEKKQTASIDNTSSKSNTTTKQNSSSKNNSNTNNKETTVKTTNNANNSQKDTASKNTNNTSNSTQSPSNEEKKDLTATKEGRLTLAKQEAKKVAKQIIKSGMTKYEKGKAICDYITNNVASQGNQSSEAYKTNYGNEAYAALIMKIAACSGRCKAAVLLCNEAGLKCEHVNQGQWTHQWLKVQIDDGSWVVMDPQIGLFGADKHFVEE